MNRADINCGLCSNVRKEAGLNFPPISRRSPEMLDYMKKQSCAAAWMTPEDMQKLLVREVDQWSRVVREVGVPLQ